MNKNFKFIYKDSFWSLEIFILYIQNIKKVLKCKYKNILISGGRGKGGRGLLKKPERRTDLW